MEKAFALLVLFAAPMVGMDSKAYAYVDPGLISSLYQALYIAVFGVAMGVVVKPARFFAGLFHKFKRLFKSNS